MAGIIDMRRVRRIIRPVPALVLLGGLLGLTPSGSGRAPRAFPRLGHAGADTLRDGSHDFDFEIGSWTTQLRRLRHPLTGDTTWLEYTGTSEVRKVWDGRANLVELDVTGPAGHIVGLSLRLYDPQSRQWSLNFANAAQGRMSVPTVGAFRNGVGEFHDMEDYNGRMILIRNVIRDITATSYRFEQSFSDDGGATWELNWVAVDTRR